MTPWWAIFEPARPAGSPGVPDCALSNPGAKYWSRSSSLPWSQASSIARTTSALLAAGGGIGQRAPFDEVSLPRVT